MVGNVAQLDRAANNNMGLVYLVCPLPLQPGMLQGCNGQTILSAPADESSPPGFGPGGGGAVPPGATISDFIAAVA